MREALGRIKWVLLFLFLAVVVSYAAITIYGNVAGQQTASADPPTLQEAQYEVVFLRTNNMIYTNTVEQKGTIYTVRNYWEMSNNKWTLRNVVLPLDTRVIGNIIVHKRQ